MIQEKWAIQIQPNCNIFTFDSFLLLTLGECSKKGRLKSLPFFGLITIVSQHSSTWQFQPSGQSEKVLAPSLL
jgi:hypothetical protein